MCVEKPQAISKVHLLIFRLFNGFVPAVDFTSHRVGKSSSIYGLRKESVSTLYEMVLHDRFGA